MLNKKFNSKQAGFDTEYGMGLNPLDLEGFQIYDPNVLEGFGEDDEQTGTLSSEVKTYQMSPDELQKLRERKYSPPGRISDHYITNQDNKISIGRALAAIPKLFRSSKKYQCPFCHGERESLKPGQSLSEQKICPGCWGSGHTFDNPERSLMDVSKYVETYNRAIKRHDDPNPDKGCSANSCKKNCSFKGIIDQAVRAPAMKSGLKLKKSDTHLRADTTNPIIKSILRPKSASDTYKGPAPILQILSGKEDDPLREYDMVHFINHDTHNPNTDLVKDDDQGFHRFEETYESPVPGGWTPKCGACMGTGEQKIGDKSVPCTQCKDESGNSTGREPWKDTSGKVDYDPVTGQAKGYNICAVCGKEKSDLNHTTKQFPVHEESIYSEGGRDKNMFSIISRVNHERGTADIINLYTPIEIQRKERRERTKGYPERGIKLNASDPFNKDADIYDDEDKKLKEGVESIFKRISPFRGEISPAQQKIARVQRDVPISSLQRVDPIGQNLLSTAGVITRGSPKTDTIHKLSTGLDQDTLRNVHLITKVPDDVDYIKNTFRRMDADYSELKRNNPHLPELSEVSLSAPVAGKEIKQRRKAPSISLPSRKTKFKNELLSNLGLPSVEVPGEAIEGPKKTLESPENEQ